MEALSLRLPAMYGDHHVTEVRRILLELPGVSDVYASSAHQTVLVQLDPQQVDQQAIMDRLEQAGYLHDLRLPVESGVPVYGRDDRSETYFRHTAAFRQTRSVVSFAQKVSDGGRPLWPCPGMGTITKGKEGDDV